MSRSVAWGTIDGEIRMTKLRVPAPILTASDPARRSTIGRRNQTPGQRVCASLIVETGHLPSWPRIEMRSPCRSSSQTGSTVPAIAIDCSMTMSGRTPREYRVSGRVWTRGQNANGLEDIRPKTGVRPDFCDPSSSQLEPNGLLCFVLK